jgi:hypothetical protein
MADSIPYAIRSLMSPKEQILWVEKPYLWDISPSATKNFVLYGGIALIGFAISMGWMTVFENFRSSSIPMFWMMIGIFNAIIIPLWSLYKRSRTTYVLTDRRIAIHQDGFWSNTYSYHLNTLGNLTFQRSRSGRGSIFLSGTPIALGNVKENAGNSGGVAEVSAVRNVAQIYELIIATKEKAAVQEMPVLTETPVRPRSIL